MASLSLADRKYLRKQRNAKQRNNSLIQNKVGFKGASNNWFFWLPLLNQPLKCNMMETTTFLHQRLAAKTNDKYCWQQPLAAEKTHKLDDIFEVKSKKKVFKFIMKKMHIIFNIIEHPIV